MTIDYYKMFGVKKPTRKAPETYDEVKEALQGKLFALVDGRKYGVLGECIAWLMARHERLVEENTSLKAENERLKEAGNG